MKKSVTLRAIWIGLCLVAASGCHKQSAAPQTIEAARVPEVIQDAFQNANPELKAEVETIETAAKNQDPAAITNLMLLMHRPDLTPQQRSAASRCLPSLLISAQQAAAQGDERAAEAVKAYNISK